jgi:hypothetical protein
VLFCLELFLDAILECKNEKVATVFSDMQQRVITRNSNFVLLQVAHFQGGLQYFGRGFGVDGSGNIPGEISAVLPLVWLRWPTTLRWRLKSRRPGKDKRLDIRHWSGNDSPFRTHDYSLQTHVNSTKIILFHRMP